MKRIINLLRIPLFVFLFLVTISFPLYATNEILKVHFLDVGQADSIIIQLPTKQTMIIDGGNNADGMMIVHYLQKLGIQKIDYLIGTHPHEDHIGGLDNLINNYSIGKIYLPKVTTTTKTFEDLLLAIKAKNLKIISAQRGMEIIQQNDLQAIILAPSSNSKYSNLNDWSIVVKLTYQQTSFLFTGDAQEESELEMLRNNCQLKADLLKVGHHGSHTSTTERFLQAVSPDYSIISVGGGNKYGHPANSVINRLQKHGIKLYRTDQLGTIIASSDGSQITFNQKAFLTNAEDNHLIVISKVDLAKEVVTIQNTGQQSVDISNWKLISIKGEQSFTIPSGTILKSGQTVQIVSGKNAQSGKDKIIWTNKYIWNNDGDPAELYDSFGNLISRYGGI